MNHKSKDGEEWPPKWLVEKWRQADGEGFVIEKEKRKRNSFGTLNFKGTIWSGRPAFQGKKLHELCCVHSLPLSFLMGEMNIPTPVKSLYPKGYPLLSIQDLERIRSVVIKGDIILYPAKVREGRTTLAGEPRIVP